MTSKGVVERVHDPHCIRAHGDRSPATSLRGRRRSACSMWGADRTTVFEFRTGRPTRCRSRTQVPVIEPKRLEPPRPLPPRSGGIPREIVHGTRLVTQTLPSPTATAAGPLPTVIGSPTTVFVSGLIGRRSRPTALHDPHGVEADGDPRWVLATGSSRAPPVPPDSSK